MASESEEKRETSADIADEIRRAVESMGDEMPYTVSAGTMRRVADRIKAAWEREREASEDETLVKSCNTCKHFTRKRKWCLVHDYSPHDPSTLPLIWPNGPCPQWECKYNGIGCAK